MALGEQGASPGLNVTAPGEYLTQGRHPNRLRGTKVVGGSDRSFLVSAPSALAYVFARGPYLLPGFRTQYMPL